MKLISIDLKSNFGFFKKPDINDSIYLTYNMIHKPALLGLLGAILGLQGHQSYGKLPEYYVELQNERKLQIGIEPIDAGQTNGNFEKSTVKYNNATGHASAGTLNILEQILIKPAYRIYLELDENEELYRRLKKYEAIFIPYLGKNDFPCWWENFKEDYGNITSISSGAFRIKTIFRKPKDTTLNELREQIAFGFIAGMRDKAEAVFSQFERLPIDFNEELKQYSEPEEFVYTNMRFSTDKFSTDKNFKQLENGDVVYLF